MLILIHGRCHVLDERSGLRFLPVEGKSERSAFRSSFSNLLAVFHAIRNQEQGRVQWQRLTSEQVHRDAVRPLECQSPIACCVQPVLGLLCLLCDYFRLRLCLESTPLRSYRRGRLYLPLPISDFPRFNQDIWVLMQLGMTVEPCHRQYFISSLNFYPSNSPSFHVWRVH